MPDNICIPAYLQQQGSAVGTLLCSMVAKAFAQGLEADIMQLLLILGAGATGRQDDMNATEAC